MGNRATNTTITVRGIEPGDKSWLKREAHLTGVSMEEFVRRLIHEKRRKAECPQEPSEAFRRYFGPRHGVEFPPLERQGYRPILFSDEDET